MTKRRAFEIIAVSPLAILAGMTALVQGVIALRTDYLTNARTDLWMAADSRKFAQEIIDSRAHV